MSRDTRYKTILGIITLFLVALVAYMPLLLIPLGILLLLAGFAHLMLWLFEWADRGRHD